MNLSRFQRPSRYINGEVNAVRKDATINVALAFPDIYDVGMSHLGLKILYDIINRIPNASADRAFHPWPDAEQDMKARGITLRSLEGKRKLSDFDLVGFSLQYELCYTSVMNMIEMGGIALKREERNNDDPIIIAGGPCTVNPVPMEPFIDAFLIGDGEDAVIEIVSAMTQWRECGDGRRESILAALATIKGVYVPGLSTTVTKRYIDSLEDAPFPTSPIVPFTEIIHDRINIEVSRGCTQGCRFCQAGMIYRPLRERSPGKILELAKMSLKSTGYEEVAFTSLSAGDYSCLKELLAGFNQEFADKKIAISLPSLRVKAVNEDILREIRSVRKTGFTIAPEAATPRLRAIINKDFAEEDFERAIHLLFKEGWSNVKLYYMIGLPEERDEDIEAIPDMVKRALKIAKKQSKRFANITASISPFTPKAHTPFQWVGQATTEYFKEKKQYIFQNLKRFKVKGHDERMSMLEGAFARGGKEMSVLLEAAYRKGARLDGWSEHFNIDLWLDAMQETGVDAQAIAQKSYDLDDDLPWDFVDTGVSKKFLKREYKNALKQAKTPDCRNVCTACGIQCKEGHYADEMDRTMLHSPELPKSERKPIKLRVEFSKLGLMRYLSHRELITHITRALRRAGVAMEYSQGFHPAPKIAFGPPLPVGVSGASEYFDMDVIPTLTMSVLIDRINAELAEGIKINAIAPLAPKVPSLQKLVSVYTYEIAFPDDGDTSAMINKFMSQDEVIYNREKGPIDIRKMVTEATLLDSGNISLTVNDLDTKKVRLDEVTETIFGKKLMELDATRTTMAGRFMDKLITPGEVNKACQAAS